MPRIINTFSSSNPFAESIKSLGQSYFGDTLTPALKRQQLADAQREALGVEELARTFGGAGDGNVNFTRAAESAVLGGLKPEDVAMFTNFVAGNITGPRSTQTTNAMAGAGKYRDSAENLDFDRANAFGMNAADNETQRYGYDTQAATSRANNTDDNTRLWDEFLQKPIDALVNGQPAFVRQGEAAQPLDQMAALEYTNQNAKRPLPVTDELGARLREAVTAVYGPEYSVRVFSGGQSDQAHGTGSVRHNGGKAADVHIIGPDGKQISGDALAPLGQYWAAKKYGGVGMEMHGGGIHLDEWATPPAGGGMSWNYAERGGNYTPAMDKAVRAGLEGQMPAGRPSVAPIVDSGKISPLEQLRGFLTAADVAMPGATAEQKRAWAVEQISKSKNKGIVIGPDGTVQIGGSGEFDSTSAVKTQLQKSQINYDKFKATIGMARDVAAKNPNIFGVVGIGRQSVQDAAEIAKSLGEVFGVRDIQGTLAGLQQDAAAQGFDTNLFGAKYDPALGQIESLGKIIAYSGASTIAGQSGNEISNNDVDNISQILGDPRDWAMNQQRFLTKLQQVEDYVNSQMQVNSKYMFGQPGGGTLPPPAATVPPPAPKESWTIGPDGKPLRIQ